MFGAVYCAVPALGWFAWVTANVPFREVYLLRLGLCLSVGCLIAVYLNRYGLELWLTKHRSADGPATILDGTLVGAAIGIGSALLPSLTALIRTHHPQAAMVFILVTYLAATAVGAVLGTILAAIGRQCVERVTGTPGEGSDDRERCGLPSA